MDAEVWGKLPEELLLWEVVVLLPPTNLVQLHSVSRTWRAVLTSARFRDSADAAKTALAAAAAAGSREPPQQEQQRGVLACVSTTPRDGACARDGTSSNSSSASSTAVDIDLSFVPASFWSPDADEDKDGCPYSVVAAGDGLVCIANASELYMEHTDPEEAWEPCQFPAATTRYCALNPLTRTCVVLLAVPIQPWVWLPPTGGVGHVRGTSDCPWVMATCDLLAGGGGGGGGEWAVAGLSWEYALPIREHPWLSAPAVACAGDSGDTHYHWYHSGWVHTVARPAGPGDPAGSLAPAKDSVGAPLREMMRLHGLRYDDELFRYNRIGLREFSNNAAFVVPHAGAVFFVTRTLPAPVPRESGDGCRPVQLPCSVWRWGRKGWWTEVARLDAREVEWLTWWSRVKRECEVRVVRVYGAREMLCFHLFLRKLSDSGEYWTSPVHFVLGFNLDERAWELLHSKPQVGVYSKVPTALELRPDLFLPHQTAQGDS